MFSFFCLTLIHSTNIYCHAGAIANKADIVPVSLQVTQVILASDEALYMTHTTPFNSAFLGLVPFSDFFSQFQKGYQHLLELSHSLPARKRIHSPIGQIKNLELSLVGLS